MKRATKKYFVFYAGILLFTYLFSLPGKAQVPWYIGGNNISSGTAVFGTLSAGSVYDIAFQRAGNSFLSAGNQNLSLGYANSITGNNSMALGYSNTVSNPYSIAFGNNNTLRSANDAIHSFGMGEEINSYTASKRFFAMGYQIAIPDYAGGFVIGTGTDANNPLTASTNIHSLSIGFNSNIPTLYVSSANGNNTTGNVYIGFGNGNTQSLSAFKLDVNGSFRSTGMAVFQSNVGIGTVATGTDRLTVNGTTRLQHTSIYTQVGASVYNPTAPPDPSPFQIINFNGMNDSYYLYVKPNNGFTGLGTEIPMARLHVMGGGIFSDRVLIGTSSFVNGFTGFQMKNKDLLITDENNNQQFKVNRDGQLWARKIYVTSTTIPADYVFSSQYSLMPLAELKQYIQQNHHLPHIPSAEEIAAANQLIDIENFQMKLLEKVEELTLYVIQQQAEIDALRKKVKE